MSLEERVAKLEEENKMLKKLLLHIYKQKDIKKQKENEMGFC